MVTRIKSKNFYNEDLEWRLVEIAQTMNEYFPRPYLILEGSLKSSEYGDSVMSLLTKTNIFDNRNIRKTRTFDLFFLIGLLFRKNEMRQKKYIYTEKDRNNTGIQAGIAT